MRPRRANRAQDSLARAPTTVVDTLFTEGVLPTREGEGGRGEPLEVRGGIGTGVLGATADDPRICTPHDICKALWNETKK